MSSENKLKHTYINKTEDQRLDLYIGSVHPELSRTQIQKLIKTNFITVNSKPSKASLILSDGDIIEINTSFLEKKELLAFQQDIEIEIIFEDENILVINKHIGLVTHPGAGNKDQTLVNGLYDKLLKNDPVRPGVVHRLDKDTSGLLVLAKTQVAYDSLVNQFKNKTAHRIYWALSFGRFKEAEGKLETKLARHPKNRKKFCSQKEGKIAITNYKVLQEGPLSLVELALETGRTHQIRVHLSEIGHPVLHDPIYSSTKKINDLQDPAFKAKARKVGRLALVAKELSFTHPTTNEVLTFEVPWPKELQII